MENQSRKLKQPTSQLISEHNINQDKQTSAEFKKCIGPRKFFTLLRNRLRGVICEFNLNEKGQAITLIIFYTRLDL